MIDIMSNGGTVFADTLAPVSTGFVVGGRWGAIVIEPEADCRQARESAFEAVRASCAPGLSVGWWLDTETGRVWVEAVDVVDTRPEALALAQARGELAIFDLSTEMEVRL